MRADRLRKGLRSPRLRNFLKKTAVTALWLVLWQLVYMAVDMELLVASPAAVVRRLWILGGTSAFWMNALLSLGRITAGFLLGCGAGVLLAAACCRFAFARAFFSPAVTVVKSTPVASFIILALVWLTGQWVPVFIAFLIVLPVVYANVSEGIRATDPALLEMAAVYGMPRRRRLTAMTVPSVMPYFMAACRSALGMAWKAGVAAEVIGVTRNSVGRELYYAKIYLETADMFAWTAVVVVMSLLLEKGFVTAMERISRRYHWK